MKNEYFNIICQKAAGGKMVIMAVVPDDLLGKELPSIFEVNAIRLVPTIYTGAYPTIKVLTGTIKNRTEDLKGMGVDGIITGCNWWNVSVDDNNDLGINI